MTTRTTARSASSSKVPWLVAAGVAVALAVIAVVVSGGGDDGGEPSSGDDVAATRPVTVTGAPLPPLTDPADDAAVGSLAPTLTGATFDGTPMAIDPADGTAKIVLFVAHWCPHCQREVPFLVEHLADSPLPADVELLTVSTAVDPKAPNHPPQAWLAAERWDHPVLADDEAGAAATAYGLSAFPFFVAVAADGTVAARTSGELTADQFDALVATVSDDLDLDPESP